MKAPQWDEITRRRFLRTAGLAPAIPGSRFDANEGGRIDATERTVRRARLVASALPGDDAPVPFRPAEFGIVGVFDVDWLRTPRFRRVFEYLSSSPGAFHGVRFFGALNSGTKESVEPAESPTVWPASGDPIDFSVTFDALAELVSHGLTPFVVLSFFPPAVSPSPTRPPGSFERWTRLVTRLFDELAADPRFGDAISEWWFEVWNEPNVEAFWQGDFERYLDLYRATAVAVDEAAAPDVRLGGPTIAYFPGGSADTAAPLMRRFLRFVSDEALQCDFLSFHGKGSTGDADPGLERTVAAARETAETALDIDRERFEGVSIINDEADMKVGFANPYEPRMTEQFPAWLSGVTVAYDALNREFADAGLRFLASSDDANQQLVRAPFDGRRSVLTRASWSSGDLFKVPVYNYYELLPLLGDRHGRLVEGEDHLFPRTELFHAATVADTHLGLLFTVYPTASSGRASSWGLTYTLRDVPWSKVNVARFQIDRYRSNAYTAAGRTLAPTPPSAADARRVRQRQELTVATPIERGVEVAAGTLTKSFALDPFTTTLYWITPYRPERTPAAPHDLEATVEDDLVVLSWNASRESFVYSYEVYVVDDGRPRERISPEPLRSARWVSTAPADGTRTYGVRAVSASGTAGPLATTDPVPE